MVRACFVLALVVFVIGFSDAGRPPRDVPVEGNAPDLGKAIENAWSNFQKQMEQTFTKENLDKLANEFKEFGDKVKAAGTDLVNKIETKSEGLKN